MNVLMIAIKTIIERFQAFWFLLYPALSHTFCHYGHFWGIMRPFLIILIDYLQHNWSLFRPSVWDQDLSVNFGIN